jgi:hypothetical protein
VPLQIHPLRVRRNNAKLLTVAMILTIPYAFCAGSDSADRMGSWGLLVFIGHLTFVITVLGFYRKRLRRNSLEAEAKTAADGAASNIQ